MWYVWLIISGLFLVLEMITVGFLVFWLAIGALFAMLVSFFTSNLIIQTTVFVISSIGLIFLTKPLVKKLNKTDDTIATNAYSVIGKKAIVTQDIDPTLGYGQIKVNGETWSAKTISDNIIPKDSEVIIKNIDNYFVLSVITSVLTIICGIVLIINPSISAVMITTMIGIVVLVYAVFDIVDAFILKHRVKEISKYFEQLLK